MATPVLTRPFELGADLVVHSASKYLNGHGDVLAGAVLAARPDPFWERDPVMAAQRRRDAGAVRGVAAATGHAHPVPPGAPRVRDGAGPGQPLPPASRRSPPCCIPGCLITLGHQIAARRMTGEFGGMLSIRIARGAGPAQAVLREVRVIKRATSLGGGGKPDRAPARAPKAHPRRYLTTCSASPPASRHPAT